MKDPRWDVSLAAGLVIQEEGDLVHLSATTDTERAFLANAAEKLQALQGLGVAPRCLGAFDGMLTLERITGSYEGDEMAWLWGACDLLQALDACDIKHGDLAPKNLLHRGDRPIAIDFQESVWYEDGIATKRPQPDAEILWKSAVEITGDEDRRFRRWQAIQPHLDEAGILDLGCSSGHFGRLAEVDSEAVWIYGFDLEPHKAWHGLMSERLIFDAINILELPPRVSMYPVPPTAFVLSTWPYLVQQAGLTEATGWLRSIVRLCGQTFFETQLFGDGPGASIHPTDGMVARWLQDEIRCTAEPLVTIPVFPGPCLQPSLDIDLTAFMQVLSADFTKASPCHDFMPLGALLLFTGLFVFPFL